MTPAHHISPHDARTIEGIVTLLPHRGEQEQGLYDTFERTPLDKLYTRVVGYSRMLDEYLAFQPEADRIVEYANTHGGKLPAPWGQEETDESRAWYEQWKQDMERLRDKQPPPSPPQGPTLSTVHAQLGVHQLIDRCRREIRSTPLGQLNERVAKWQEIANGIDEAFDPNDPDVAAAHRGEEPVNEFIDITDDVIRDAARIRWAKLRGEENEERWDSAKIRKVLLSNGGLDEAQGRQAAAAYDREVDEAIGAFMAVFRKWQTAAEDFNEFSPIGLNRKRDENDDT